MPRRQRFKPSRKPKPAIEPSELSNTVGEKPVNEREQELHDQPVNDPRRDEAESA